MTELLMTIAEVAQTLRTSRSGVYRLFGSGELRWVRVGSHRRVTGAELDRFIGANTQAAS